MKKVLDIHLAISHGNFTKHLPVPIKVTCVFGRPTADPEGKEIPLRVKDILMNDRPLDYNQRQLIIEWVGGEGKLAEIAEGF